MRLELVYDNKRALETVDFDDVCNRSKGGVTDYSVI